MNRTLRKLPVAIGISVALALLIASPGSRFESVASAQTTGGDDAGVFATTPATPGNEPSPDTANNSSGHSGTQRPCRYVQASEADDSGFNEDGSFPLPPGSTDIADWDMWMWECIDSSNYFDPPTGAGNELVWRRVGNAPPQPPTYGQLAQIARGLIPWPSPTVAFAPDGRQVVNVPSWVWATGVTRNDVQGGHAHIAAYNIDIWAVAVPYRLDVQAHAGGAATSCEGLGTPGAGDCNFTFDESARTSNGSPCVTSAARVAYRIDYYGFDYNSAYVARLFNDFTVGVDEIQSVNVSKDGGAAPSVAAGQCDIG